MNLRMLAKTIGVQVGSLYNYIDSKQQLLFWLLKEAVERLLVEFDQRLGEIDDPPTRLRDLSGFTSIIISVICNNRWFWAPKSGA